MPTPPRSFSLPFDLSPFTSPTSPNDPASDDAPVVHVVDSDRRARDAVRRLEPLLGAKVAGWATAEEFLRAADPIQIGCVLLDLNLPGIGGLGMQAELRSHGVQWPVLVVTSKTDVASAVRALQAGALALVEKPVSDRWLLDSIRGALAVGREARRVQHERAVVLRQLAFLSRREREVMHHLVAGEANKVIAYDLGISERTVESHRAQVMRKTGSASFADLVRFAERAEEVLRALRAPALPETARWRRALPVEDFLQPAASAA